MVKNGNSKKVEMFSQKITQGIGSIQSIILHTFAFIGIFGLYFFGLRIDQIMLILTTAVSLEAIYLALFIQMTVNKNTESLEEVEEDLGDIQDDVENLEDDIGQIQEDVQVLEENVEDITENVEDISEDLEQPNEISHTHEVGPVENQTFSVIEKQLLDITKNIAAIKIELEELKK